MSKENAQNQDKKFRIGGSALMEGIMMIGPKGIGMSLRMPDGTIETQMKERTPLKDKHKIARIPFIRGPINFVEQMIFSYKCLMESAEKTSMEVDGEEEDMSKLDKWLTDHFGPKMMAVIGAISMVLGVGLAFLLFVYLPSLAADGLDALIKEADITKFKPLIEGLVRAVLFVLYMLGVSYMKDIKRMFMYHGAEHKSIFCYENGLPLTVENIRNQKRFHPRCGTSFLFVVIMISIIVGSFIKISGTWARMGIKLLVLPIVVGVSYEINRWVGRHDIILSSVLSWPGRQLQRITTNEPDDSMIECAIRALELVIPEEVGSDKW